MSALAIQRLPIGAGQEETAKLGQAFEQLWVSLNSSGMLGRLGTFLLIVIVLYAISRFVSRGINRQIEDVNRRHQLRKFNKYAFYAALLAAGVVLFAERLALADLGTVIGLIAAAVTIALADVVRSLAGWIYVNSRSGIQIGSRVEVDKVTGDVIDIGMLKTTLLEVGEPLVHGLQSTGRIVSVPNSVFLMKNVVASASVNPLVWQELQILVTFESDWKAAREILKEIAQELYEEIVPHLKAGFAKMERRYAFRLGSTAPIVYTEIAESGVLLTLRYLTNVRRRRGTVNRVSEGILDRFTEEPDIEFAYPTYRIYRLGEERPRSGLGLAAPPFQVATEEDLG